VISTPLHQWFSDLCSSRPPVERSSKWSAVRKAHLAKQPTCQWCGGSMLLDVHHIFPVHVYPCLELCPSNLITLCRLNSCHFEMGHNGDWHEYNVEIEFQCEEKQTERQK